MSLLIVIATSVGITNIDLTPTAATITFMVADTMLLMVSSIAMMKGISLGSNTNTTTVTNIITAMNTAYCDYDYDHDCCYEYYVCYEYGHSQHCGSLFFVAWLVPLICLT